MLRTRIQPLDPSRHFNASLRRPFSTSLETNDPLAGLFRKWFVQIFCDLLINNTANYKSAPFPSVRLVSKWKYLKNPEEANYMALVLPGLRRKGHGHLTRWINQSTYDTFPNRIPLEVDNVQDKPFWWKESSATIYFLRWPSGPLSQIGMGNVGQHCSELPIEYRQF